MTWWRLLNPTRSGNLDALFGLYGQSNGVGSGTGSYPGTPSGLYVKNEVERTSWASPHDMTPAILDVAGRGCISECKAGKSISYMLNTALPRMIEQFQLRERTPNFVIGWQGEADAKTEVDALAWAGTATECNNLIRSAFGPIPLGFMELLTTKVDTYPFHELLRSEQHEWAEREGVTLFPTVGVIPLQADLIHATSEGQIIAGGMVNTWAEERAMLPT